jgi:LysM repeat protein
MSDRGLPTADGSPACPFVAFEDDRDERADRPDHRHRCFAEAVPAPRALAHQEAYCLSSAFPVCPTFQDWARREAAEARPGRAVPADPASAAGVGAAAFAGDGDDPAEGDDREDDVWGAPRDVPVEERPRRNPPRDWAAPPPWAAGSAAAGVGGAGAAEERGLRGDDPVGDSLPEEGRGLAGSAADRLASGEDPDRAWSGHATPRLRSTGTEAPAGPSAPPDPELAGLVGRREVGRIRADVDDGADEPRPSTRRPAVSSTRARSRDRDRERATEERAQHDGPSWERVRRYEAYPSIKARAGLPGAPQLPRITVLVGALVVAALLLFLLPTILNIGGRVQAPGTSVASPTGAAASASLEPTPVPAPTPHIYTIKAGDALARIARQFGLTLEQLLAANKDIKDPNRIQAGQKIVIPTPPPDEVSGESPAASPKASP